MSFIKPFLETFFLSAPTFQTLTYFDANHPIIYSWFVPVDWLVFTGFFQKIFTILLNLPVASHLPTQCYPQANFEKFSKPIKSRHFSPVFFDFQTSLVEQTDLVELFSELLWRFLLILSFFSFFHFYNFSFSFITSVTSQKKQNLVNYLIIDL